MELTIEFERKDWELYQAYLEKELPKSIKRPTDNFFVSIAIWTIVGIIAISMYNNITEFDWPTALFVSGIFIIILTMLFSALRRMRQAYAPSDEGTFIGTHHFRITNEGIETKGAGYMGKHSWAVVKKIVRADGMILIFIDTALAFIFPEAKLSDPDHFFKYLKECSNTLHKG